MPYKFIVTVYDKILIFSLIFKYFTLCLSVIFKTSMSVQMIRSYVKYRRNLGRKPTYRLQLWGDGYLAGINPAWTWSHAGYSISALGGWSHWPWWEKQRLPQFRGVGGTWNRLMPWFVISGPQGSRSPYSDRKSVV